MKLKLIYETKGRAREYSEYALDIYSGCNVGCKYCFNKPESEVRVRDEFSLSRLENDCKKLSNLEEKNFKVLLCFSSDPYNDLAVETGLTRMCLEILNKYNINFRVLTKRPSRAIKDFDLYKPGDEFGITLSFSDEVSRKEWEPGASSIEERVEGLKEAKRKNIYTWLSIEPVVYTEEALNVIELTKGYVDKYKVGKINHNPEIEERIDWKDFGTRVTDKLKEMKDSIGCEYYIKKDLREAIEDEN